MEEYWDRRATKFESRIEPEVPDSRPDPDRCRSNSTDLSVRLPSRVVGKNDLGRVAGRKIAAN